MESKEHNELGRNKTKVLSVQLGKTLSFVKFVVEWGGVEGEGVKTLHGGSLTKEAYIQILAMPRTLLNVFGGGVY